MDLQDGTRTKWRSDRRHAPVRWTVRALGVAGLLLSPAPLLAAPMACTLPGTIPAPHPYGPSPRDPVRNLPTASYTLALTWAPQYCRTGEGMGGTFDNTFECSGANRFGFVMHGLWPDGAGKEWPQYCRPAALLNEATVRANLCMTPSADLLQHEWVKHGTCVEATPDAYFAAERALYAKLRFPDMERLSRQDHLTVRAFVRTFVAANRRARNGLTAQMVRVALSRDGWLQEVRLCLDRERRFAPCRVDQAGGAPASARLRIDTEG